MDIDCIIKDQKRYADEVSDPDKKSGQAHDDATCTTAGKKYFKHALRRMLNKNFTTSPYYSNQKTHLHLF